MIFIMLDINKSSEVLNCHHESCSGADYGLGTIGTCLRPPPAGGAPSDQKKKKNPKVTVKKGIEHDKNGDIVGYIIFFCKP